MKNATFLTATFKLYIRLIKYLLFRNSDIIHLRVENEKMEIK